MLRAEPSTAVQANATGQRVGKTGELPGWVMEGAGVDRCSGLTGVEKHDNQFRPVSALRLVAGCTAVGAVQRLAKNSLPTSIHACF